MLVYHPFGTVPTCTVLSNEFPARLTQGTAKVNGKRTAWPARSNALFFSRMYRRFHISPGMIFFSLILLNTAGALLLAGCSGEGKKQLVVAFSQANNAEPYRAAQNAFMTTLLAPHTNIKLVISDAQQDNSKQVAQVETFIRQKPDLLIVAPNERAALTAVMGQAMAAKIPVICLERDSDILQPNYTAYIHGDNIAIG